MPTCEVASPSPRHRSICLLGLSICLLGTAAPVLPTAGAMQDADNRISPAQRHRFEQTIRPLLIEHCYACHSTSSGLAEGGLRLDSREGWQRGGSSGPVIVPGVPNRSLLVALVNHADPDRRMPPPAHGPALSPQQRQQLEHWIAEGAPDPRQATMGDPSLSGQPDAEPNPTAWPSWWDRGPAAPVPFPETSDIDWAESWVWNPIDRFIARGLADHGLRPVADADDPTLLRRLTFDLLGLPPSLAVQSQWPASLGLASLPFPSDPGSTRSPTDGRPQRVTPADRQQSITRFVDQQLADPAFGHHWARHWLDLMRFAESNGRDFNATYPEAWRYRDYCVDAFNSNMPLDQFIKEQVAGDLLYGSGARSSAALRGKIATGWFAFGPKTLGERNREQFAVDMADEQLDTLFQAFTGLTVACARCHDHKFDPISQRDYTALLGIFLSTETYYGTLGGSNNGSNAGRLIDPGRRSGLVSARPPRSDVEVQRWERQLAQARQRLSETNASLAASFINQRQAMRAGRSQTADTDASAARTTTEAFDASPTEMLMTMMADTSPENTSNRAAPQERLQRERQQLLTNIRQLEHLLESYDRSGVPQPRLMGVQDKPPPPKLSAPRAGPRGNRTRPGRLPLDYLVDSPFYVRGELELAGASVPRGLPEHWPWLLPQPLPTGQAEHSSNGRTPTTGSGRLELARWLTDPQHPLTARVMANRLWTWTIGRGLVDTVDLFGNSGLPPSHPELLDYLAAELIDSGWDAKHLIRLIVTSRTYQLSSQSSSDAQALDPDNRRLWRRSPQPLRAEQLHDALLMIGGQLDRRRPLGSVIAAEEDGRIGPRRVPGGLSEPSLAEAVTVHRAIYLPAPRGAGSHFLSALDLPAGDMVQGQRQQSPSPARTLAMLNSPLVTEAAEHLAQQVVDHHRFPQLPGSDPTVMRARIDEVYRSVLGRPPTEAEYQTALRMLPQVRSGVSQAAYRSLVRVLIASAEFMHLD
jgi:hypothetical protein